MMIKMNNGLLKILITILIGILISISFQSKVYADIKPIISANINAFSDNWQEGLILKTSTKSTKVASSGNPRVISKKDIVFFRLGKPGYDMYEVRLTNTSQTATIRYNNIGTYGSGSNKINVDCKAKFQATSIHNPSRSRLLISKNFYNGFLYYYLYVKVTYTFYESGTNTEIKTKNSIFSANSLNKGEGIRYDGSSTGYVSSNTLVKYESNYFHGTSNSGWTDVIGGKDFDRATVSFKLKETASHTFYYKAAWKYNWNTDEDVWVSPSTIPVGTPKIPPEKSVNKKSAKKGEIIVYTITQKLHKSGTNYLKDYYSSLKFVDELPSGLKFVSATIKSSNTNDGGKWKQTRNGQTITYECTNPNSLKLIGQKYTITIKCKITKKEGTIKNTAQTYMNGYVFKSNEVTTTIKDTSPPQLSNTINKVGPNVITDYNNKVTYNIEYNASVKNYKGNARVVIRDMLPYEIDESKSNLNGGIYNNSNRSITWTIQLTNINSTSKLYKRNIKKKIDVFFKNVDISDNNITNTVYGQISTSKAPVVSSDLVEDSVDSSVQIPKVMDLVVTKKWEDSKTYGASRRPQNVQFALVKNGKITNILSNKINIAENEAQITFNNLIIYDENGKQIEYSVKEVSKLAGDIPATLDNEERLEYEGYNMLEDDQNSNNDNADQNENEENSDSYEDDEFEEEEEEDDDDDGNESPTANEDEEGNGNLLIDEDGEIVEGEDPPEDPNETTVTEPQINYKAYNLREIKGNLIESKEDLLYYQDYVQVGKEEYKNGKKIKYIDVTNKYTSINIKGNVWKDIKIDGKRANEEGFPGVEVRLLFDTTNRSTNQKQFKELDYVRTNANGDYSFNDIPWNGDYKLMFLYNGQVYETTYYKNNLSGTYSNIKDNTNIRQNLNNRFATISAYPNNYNNKRAFGLKQKIKNADLNDTNYNFDTNGKVFTFEDILRIFDSVDYNYKHYDNEFWSRFENDLRKAGINNQNTITQLTQYIKDSMVYATTPISYSADSNISQLKPGTNNTIQTVSAGLAKRAQNDLSITNDVYRVTSIINGKVRTDDYNNKEEVYDVSARANNGLYNGSTLYSKPLYKSDYLFDATSQMIGDEEKNGKTSEEIAILENNYNKRNLQVFVTYRIRIKNKGKVSAKINSLVDYYDSENFETIIDIKDSNVFKSYTFLGDGNFNKRADIGIQENGACFGGNHKYNKLTIYGAERIKDESGNVISENATPLKVYHQGSGEIDDILHPEEETNVYITFKVKNNAMTNKVQINSEIKNISEINGYSTMYTTIDDVIPDQLGKNDVLVKKYIYENTNAGLVDIDSDPGSLLTQDIDSNDNLIYTKTQADKTYENMEDDTDKIGIKLQISQNEKDIRKIGGYVFEDKRNVQDNNLKVSLGNGYIEEDENAINGVTLQLVQLVPEIDEIDGIATGEYKKELVVGSYQYSATEHGGLRKTSDNTKDSIDNSYYSGKKQSKVIETGTGDLEVKAQENLKDGEYSFDSLYPGDFYVRFIYGDTDRTVMINKEYIQNQINNLKGKNKQTIEDKQELAKLQNTLEVITKTERNGLNAKSYNGQDYKSTIYQTGVGQEGQYNGIDGYQRYDTQNYSRVTNIKDKLSMYYFDLNKSDNITINGKQVRVSDAKDVYDDRLLANQYSKNIKNNNAEVLDSFEKLGSNIGTTDEEKKTNQQKLINELEKQTQMRANTGIIQVESKHKNDTTSKVDFGLVERPKSQINLNKEVSHINIVLANGQVLFNTNKSVNNLYFSKHTEHGVEYKNNKILSIPTVNRIRGNETPEIIQAYMDNELMSGAMLQVEYKMTVKNVGEVDFTDAKYYYTGIEDDKEKNILKTKVNKVVDYNSNTTIYNSYQQKEEDKWKTVPAEELINNNLVTKEHEEELKTYKTILVSEGFNKELVPYIFDDSECEDSVTLKMNGSVNRGRLVDTLIYNNTMEIIDSTNSLGRRNAYSIPGNQKLTDQRLFTNAVQGESIEDRRIPEEIDADSAQKIGILPPTGQRDYTLYIIATNIGLGLIILGAFIIKELIFKRKKNE